MQTLFQLSPLPPSIIFHLNGAILPRLTQLMIPCGGDGGDGGDGGGGVPKLC